MPGTPLDATIRLDATTMTAMRHLPPLFLSAISDQLYSEVNIADAAVALDRARAAGDGTEAIAQRLHKAVTAGVMLQNQRETGSYYATGTTTMLQNALDGVMARTLPGASSATPVIVPADASGDFVRRLLNTAAVADRMAAAAAASR